MAINFPSSPSLNDTHTDGTSGLTWTWDGASWVFTPDDITLSTDTVGDYVETVVAGLGVSIIGIGGEAATPTISIGQAVGTSDNVTFNDMTVSGNLTVSGTTTTVDTATLSIEDPLIVLASGNSTTDAVDIGFYGLYDTSGSQDLYAGLFRDASDGKFRLFVDSQTVPTTTVDTSATGYSIASLVANIEGTLTGNADTASTWATARTITLGGDLSGSVSVDGSSDVTLTATIAADSVALGTDTTGDYVGSLTQGTGVTITNNSGEGATPTIAIGQSVGTTDTVTFSTVNANLTGNVTGDLTGDVYASDGTSKVLEAGTNGTDATFTGDVTGDLTGNASTASALATARTIQVSGDVAGSASFDGSADINISTTIQANSVALTTDTTGDYVESLVQGTGVTLTNNTGEGSTPTIAIGQSVGTTDSVTFSTVSADLTGDVTGNLIGDVYASDGTSLVLDSGTNGTDATFTGDITGDVTGNASTASAWATARTITLGGDLSGSVSIDGSADVTLSATVAADSVALGTDTTGDYVESLVQGTGITITNNTGEGATPTIEIGQAVGTTDNVTFNDLTVSGNLTVSGSTTTVDTATLSVEDPLIVLASGNSTTDVVDIGFYGLYDTSGSQDLYAGLFRDATDGKFRLFKDSQTVPTTTVDTSATGYTVADLVANVEGTLTGNADSADILSTARTFTLSGDVSGSVSFDGSSDVTISTTIQADSVALGTDTTGDYVESLVAGTGVTLTNNTGESATPTVEIGQAVATTDDVTFNTVTGTNGVITLTSSGAPTSSLSDGAIAIDTTNDTLYIRSNGAWVESSGGASVTVSDAPPSSPTEGDMWFESDTGSTYVYYDSAWVEVGAATSVAVGSEGYIQYYDGGFLAGASAHYWDAANERLGIKNTSPAYEVDVTGTIRGTTIIGSGGVITLATAGAPTASLADGAIAVDTTNDVMYIRSNGAWVESSGGASVTVSDAAPTGAEEGDLWYKSDVGTTLVYYDNTWVEITGSGSSSAYKLMSSSRDAALITMEIGA